MNKTKLGLLFIILSVICPFFADTSVSFIGIMFIFLGIAMLLFTSNGLATSKLALFASIYLIIFGSSFVVIWYLVENNNLHESYYMIDMGLGVGIMFLLTFFYKISKFFICTLRIKAEYLYCNIYTTRTVVSYSPIFRFSYNNNSIENSVGEVLSKRQIKKYKEGEMYDVYINPKNPYMMLLKKNIRFSDVSLFTLGILFIAVALNLLMKI